MRYIIGYEAIDKFKKAHPKSNIEDKGCKGVYAMDWILPFTLTKNINEKTISETKIPVFYDLEEAKKEVSRLSKAYRRDDVAFSPNKKSRLIRNFFLIKLDSPKCPIIVKEENKEKSKKNNFYWHKIQTLRKDYL